jgi:site-specific recombinase XerD
MGALRTERDRTIVQAMLLGGLRRCEVLGLRLEDLRSGDWRVFTADGKGGHQRLVPVSQTFFATVARYLGDERPAEASTDRVFVALKGRTQGGPLTAEGLDEMLAGARARAGLAHGPCHELRHTCFTRLREGGMAIEALQAQAGHRSIASARIYLHLGADWLAGEYKRAAQAIEPGWGGDRPVSAVPAAQPARDPQTGRQQKLFSWEEIFARAPQMATTMIRYLDQLRVSARPATLGAYDDALRMFAGHITSVDPSCRSVAAVEHRHIEAHKTWMASRPGRGGGKLSATTISHRLCLLRTFFERIIDWDYDDAPRRCPIYKGDFPERDEPLPKFLDDPTAAKFMAALATDPDKRRRLMVELLARTGMRAGELAALSSDAMVHVGHTHWLRIPVGKLHNDRYVPLHPLLVELITDWLATRQPPWITRVTTHRGRRRVLCGGMSLPSTAGVRAVGLPVGCCGDSSTTAR